MLVSGAEPVPGCLKPMIVFFGESVDDTVRQDAEKKVNEADAMLVIGTSLATYSAWRLVKQAVESNIALGVINLGGLRGEQTFWPAGFREEYLRDGDGSKGFRIELNVGEVLDMATKMLEIKESTGVDPRILPALVEQEQVSGNGIEVYAP